MLDKQTKRDMKKTRKIIVIFLACCFPVMLVFGFLLYSLAPSLLNQQWIVIALTIVLGLILYFLVMLIIKKKEEKDQKKPKKFDPFSD